MSSNVCNSYCIVFNIPSEYRSKHLRNYFNEDIEKQVFNCFHYRHRPQNVKTFSDNSLQTNQLNDKSTNNKRFCAIIDIKTQFLDQFVDKFNKKFWINFENETDFGFKCFVNKIKVISDINDNQRKSDKTVDVLRKTIELNSSLAKHRNKEVIKRLKQKTNEFELHFNECNNELVLTLSEVKSLRELNPPIDVMPNGNVGTPLEVFLQLIRECRLPAPIISKLELDFPKSLKRKIYSRVGHKYEDKKRLKNCFVVKDNPLNDKDLDLIKSRNGFIINDNYCHLSKTSVNQKDFVPKSDVQKEDNDSDEDEVEEWDRYEALHEDVTQQERISERLFEEEIELKWEKGGSGLVFYTDAQFWDIKDNCEDFNEKTPDDWDLDLSLYRSNCSADKDAIDWKTINDEMKLRKGKRMAGKYRLLSVCPQTQPKKSKNESKIGCFEKHTKGFGSKLMESQGWKSGQGLGQSITGIPEPIEDCGQLPTDKRGFGYRGAKLKSFQFLKPKPKD